MENTIIENLIGKMVKYKKIAMILILYQNMIY